MNIKTRRAYFFLLGFCQLAGRVNGKNLINGYLHSLSAPNSVLKRLVSRTGLTFVRAVSDQVDT